MRKLIVTLLTLSMLLCSLSLTAFSSGGSLDLTADFTSDWTATTATAQAPDSLIKVRTGRPENSYRLYDSGDAKGRDSATVTLSGSGAGKNIEDNFGEVRTILTITPSGDNTESQTSGVQFENASGNGDIYLDASQISDGDKVVVSVWAKTTEAGKTTRLTAYHGKNWVNTTPNAYADTYGKNGVEITDEWTEFADVITIPENWSAQLTNANHVLHIGYPGTNATVAYDRNEIVLSTLYVAKVQAVSMTSEFTNGSSSIGQGGSRQVETKLLNQIGTTTGLDQSFTYKIMNAGRTAEVADSGITVTSISEGIVELNVGETASAGTYNLVAVGADGEVKGLEFEVEASEDYTTDFTSDWTATTATAQAPDSLVKVRTGRPENSYRLYDSGDAKGRDSATVTLSGSGAGKNIEDNFGEVRTILTITPSGNNTESQTSGVQFENASGTGDVYLDASQISDGDKMVVSIWAKTTEAGKTTRLTAYHGKNWINTTPNAYADTYGKNGVEITDEWTEFADVITIPENWSAQLTNANHVLHIGYPGTNATVAYDRNEIVLSTLYVAKVQAVSMTNTFANSESTTLNPGDTRTLETKLLNQIGTTTGLDQSFTYKIMNSGRTAEVSDSGITISGTTLSVADDAKTGSYNIVAVSADGKLKGLPVTIAEKAEVALSFESVSSVMSTYEAQPAIYVYSKFNNFYVKTPLTANCGIILWEDGKADKPVVLPAYSGNDVLMTPAPGGAFAIKAFGAAFETGKTYFAQPYAGETKGETQEIVFNSAS